MKNHIKISIVGVISSIVLSGCFDSELDATVKTYVNGLKNGDWESVAEVMEEKSKEDLARGLLITCQYKYNDVVLAKLEKNGFLKRVLSMYATTYGTLPVPDKVTSLCLETIMENEENAKNSSFEILNSQINESENKASVKISTKAQDGKKIEQTVNLKKINNKWKIVGDK